MSKDSEALHHRAQVEIYPANRTQTDMWEQMLIWHGMFSACELVTEYQIQNNRMWEEASRKSSQTLLWNIPRSHFLDGQTAGR